MKRTQWKRKPTKPMKRGKLHKKSPMKISLLQRKLWDECKRIIRKRYGNVCYTCGRSGLMGSDWQTGHLWAKASLGAFLKYDLRVLRPQCFACNIHRGGMGADFFLRMWQENGAEYMEQLKKDRQVTVKAYDHYLMLLEKYKKL
ncbi:recombination protein NinG [Candidatus Dojkabacteria bacterium]|jgi:hypothetical protein|nr:recombination protein NinG [Candidatus Dojkabacteria bacterium]